MSRVKIIGESPHEWPQTSLLTAAHMLFYFLRDFRVLKHRWIDEISHRSITTTLLWYCDITQTPIVTSFWPIVMRTFQSGSRASSCRRQVDYHSLIVKNYSQHFHWLACKKCLTNISLKVSSVHDINLLMRSFSGEVVPVHVLAVCLPCTIGWSCLLAIQTVIPHSQALPAGSYVAK